MKLLLLIFLGVLVLNALVIAGVAGILMIDHRRAKRRAAQLASKEDAHVEVS